jgi:anti-sigma28 factor (negative regulator of flagellin synthesis)
VGLAALGTKLMKIRDRRIEEQTLVQQLNDNTIVSRKEAAAQEKADQSNSSATVDTVDLSLGKAINGDEEEGRRQHIEELKQLYEDGQLAYDSESVAASVAEHLEEENRFALLLGER